jgi:hypothetical protein
MPQPDLLTEVGSSRQFVCIIRPADRSLRDWLDRFYVKPASLPAVRSTPDHAGAGELRLGARATRQSRLARLANWFDGVEPGQRVLDWLNSAVRKASISIHAGSRTTPR